MKAELGSYVDRLLTSLEVQVRGFALCKLRRGYRLALDGEDAPLIHYALKGPGVLEFRDRAPLPFVAHDLLVLPRSLAHAIIAPNGVIKEVRGVDGLSTLDDALLELSAGGGEDVVTVCGVIEASYGGGIGLFDALREPIVEHIGPADPLRGSMAMMAAEVSAPSFGTRALIEALLKQCLVLLIRRQLRAVDARPRWFIAPEDPRLTAALALMLQRPGAPHTLPQLATAAGMSRSAFALRFAAAFGQPPMEFLRDVRLRHEGRVFSRSRTYQSRRSPKPSVIRAGAISLAHSAPSLAGSEDFQGVAPVKRHLDGVAQLAGAHMTRAIWMIRRIMRDFRARACLNCAH